MRPHVQNPRVVHKAVVVGESLFGCWRVIGRAPKGNRGQERVRVRCEGGECAASVKPTESVMELTKLRHGYTRSCRTCSIRRIGGTPMGKAIGPDGAIAGAR
jgi:hypothetical protein